MSQLQIEVLPTNISGLITEDTKATVRSNKTRGSVIQALINANIPYTHFISSKSKDSTASIEFQQSIDDAIVLGFTDRVQTLLHTSTKELEDKEKAEKRYWQQQVGAKRADYKKALKKVQEPRRDPVHHSDIEKVHIKLEEVKILLQETEEELPIDIDLVDAIKRLDDLLTIFN
jgi:hypothetical protein